MAEASEHSGPPRCPFCGKVMHSHRVGEVEIDHCMECAAVWLDRGELRRIASAEIGKDVISDRALWEDAERIKGNLSNNSCPHCGIPLVELRHGPNAPVVEMCPRCHGVLLEKGELRALLKVFSEEGALDVIEEALDGKTSIPEAAERVGRHLSSSLLRLAVELETNHPYLSGLIKGLEQGIS